MTTIGLKSSKKVHKLGLCGHFRDLKVTSKITATDFKFFKDKYYTYKSYLIQFETCQTYICQVTGKNMSKMLKKGYSGGCL